MGPEDFDKDKLIQAARDLRAHTDQTFAVFLDAERGMHEQAKLLLRLKEANMTKLGFSEEQALGVVMAHVLNRADGTEEVLDASTLAETLVRIDRGGSDHVFLANMCAAWLYAFWDAQGRDQLAAAFFGKHDLVNSDLFGDLRLLRHCILHCKGIADSRVDRCKLIRWWRKGDRIEFNSRRLYAVVRSIRNFANALEDVANDPAPGIKAGGIYYGAMDAQGKYFDQPPEGARLGSPLRDPSPPKVCPKLAEEDDGCH